MTRWVPCAPVILPLLPDERFVVGLPTLTHVQGIGGFGTELERDSMLEGKGAEDSQIHIAEPRSENGIARHIAIGATRADASGDAWSVGSESCRIEPRRQLTVRWRKPGSGEDRAWG